MINQDLFSWLRLIAMMLKRQLSIVNGRTMTLQLRTYLFFNFCALTGELTENALGVNFDV